MSVELAASSVAGLTQPFEPASTVVALGGIGWGHVFRVHGRETLGRNESRGAWLLPARDFCKLQVVSHWLARLTEWLTPRPRIVAVGAIGVDPDSQGLLNELSSAGVDVSQVEFSRRRPTTYSVAIQYPDGSGCNLTATNGASALVSARTVTSAIRHVGQWNHALLGLCLPEVSMTARAALIRALRDSHGYVVASFTTAELAHHKTRSLLRSTDLLAINAEEAASLMGRPLRMDHAQGFLAGLASRVSAFNPNLDVILTCGSAGAYVLAGGRWDYCPAPEVACVSSAGAGDALLAAVLAARLGGLPLANPSAFGRTLSARGINCALDFGVLAATDKIRSIDTIPPVVSLARLSDLARQLGVQAADSRVPLGMLNEEQGTVIATLAGVPTPLL